MFAEVTAIASSGGLGAIVGLAGGIINRFQQYKMHKVNLEHDAKMRSYDLAEAKLERQHTLAMADKKMEEAELEGDIAYEQADLANLKQSIKEAGTDSGIELVETVKGLMRPFITLFLLLATCTLLGMLWSRVGGLSVFSENELIDLFRHIVQQMVFLTVTAVSWWYASRPARLDKERK